MILLEKCSKSLSLWSMKVMYGWMTPENRLQARNHAAIRMWQLKDGNLEDLKVAEMWEEFFDWASNYKD